jgi:hypothetical protein
METFDDFLNEAILNELGDGGVVDTLATGVGRKFKNFVPGLAAKIGSKKAQGELDLNNMVAQLEDDFKKYLAQQRVRSFVVEDFLEFLRTQYGFAMTDSVFDDLAYGQSSEGSGDKLAQELVSKVNLALQEQKPISEYIEKLKVFTKRNNPNGVMVRKMLWKLARANPTNAEIAKFDDVIGKKISPQLFKEMCTKIASLLLRKGGAASDTKAGGGAGDGEGAVKVEDPTDLDVGDIPFIPPMKIAKDKWASPLFAEMEQYGLNVGLAKQIALATANTKSDSEAEMRQHIQKLSKIGKNQGVNICRILLQALRLNDSVTLQVKDPDTGKFTERTGQVMDLFFGKVKGFDKGALLTANSMKAYDKSQDPPVYDGTKINRLLAPHIGSTNTVSHVILVLLGCVGATFK